MRKTKPIFIRVSPQERDQFNARAAELGLTTNELGRKLLFPDRLAPITLDSTAEDIAKAELASKITHASQENRCDRCVRLQLPGCPNCPKNQKAKS